MASCTPESDAVADENGAVGRCSCWLVDALVLADRVEETRETFTNVLDHATPLDLLSERVDPGTGNCWATSRRRSAISG